MQKADTLKELVQIARDGAMFYEDSIQKIDDPRLKSIFSDMAKHKRDLIQSLSSTLRVNDEDVPEDGTIAGKFRQGYADLRASLTKDDAKIYVSQLEESEDRLLHHFEDALEKIDDPSVKNVLQVHMPQVRACHDQMRELKKAFHG